MIRKYRWGRIMKQTRANSISYLPGNEKFRTGTRSMFAQKVEKLVCDFCYLLWTLFLQKPPSIPGTCSVIWVEKELMLAMSEWCQSSGHGSEVIRGHAAPTYVTSRNYTLNYHRQIVHKPLNADFLCRGIVILLQKNNNMWTGLNTRLKLNF